MKNGLHAPCVESHFNRTRSCEVCVCVCRSFFVSARDVRAPNHIHRRRPRSPRSKKLFLNPLIAHHFVCSFLPHEVDDARAPFDYLHLTWTQLTPVLASKICLKLEPFAIHRKPSTHMQQRLSTHFQAIFVLGPSRHVTPSTRHHTTTRKHHLPSPYPQPGTRQRNMSELSPNRPRRFSTQPSAASGRRLLSSMHTSNLSQKPGCG